MNFFLPKIRHFKILLWITGLLLSMSKSNGQRIVPDSVAAPRSDFPWVIKSVNATAAGSHRNEKKNSSVLNNRVDYRAKDSIVFDLEAQVVHLFNEADVKYDDVNIIAYVIDIDFENNELYAAGQENASAKDKAGQPVIKQGRSEYKAEKVQFNLENKKGIVTQVITKEGEGYLHGEKIKKMDDKTMFVSRGFFTTCELDHPHFAINFQKAKAVANDKIVTGPAWLSVSDIPLPLAIPFGYFPMNAEQTSGFLLPSYGYANNRGYYLRNVGWYFAINDYVDLALRGDIYTNGSWAVDARSRYVKRYGYEGYVNIRFDDNKTGITKTPSYSENRSFKIQWSHRQDAKAHPNHSFQANVNIVSPTYSKYSTNLQEYVANTTQSDISYKTKIGNKFNLTGSLGETYNINTKQISLDLPSISLSSSQFYPFRRKKTVGKLRWYENISIVYRGNMKNSIQTADSLLFRKDIYKRMRNGIQHSVPIQHTVQIFKHITWTNSLNYTAHWNFSEASKTWDTVRETVVQDTTYGFITDRSFHLSSSLSTRIYGMFQFKKGLIKAVRHVFSPSVSFTYQPDFSTAVFGYYKYYVDGRGKEHRYSRSEYSVFGAPPAGKSGTLSWVLKNNLEMKIRSNKDTVSGVRKIVLLEDLSVSGGYDFAADSLRWRPLLLSARTTLFERLRVGFSAAFTPYAADSLGRTIDVLLWEKEQKLWKQERAQWDFNVSWQFNPQKKAPPKVSIAEKAMQYSPFVHPSYLMQQADFSVAWSFQIDASYSRVLRWDYTTRTNSISQIANIGVNADIALSAKWKIGVRTGYDFINGEFTLTSIDFYRDLHCWEMRFNWIPFGFQTGWNFTIGIKASMLKDLKYEKRRDFRNYLSY